MPGWMFTRAASSYTSMTDSLFPYLAADEFFQFPPPTVTTPEGIVAMGGNLSPGMLISAYRQGIFPWFSDGEPILWWSPDPRGVLFPEKVHTSRSMRRVFSRGTFRFSLDRAFRQVITACAATPRKDQDGTWITADMIEAYIRLHDLGIAHSIEVWDDGGLAGGLYGLSLGGMFFGESMFSRVTNASKAAFITLAKILAREGFDCLDCQLPTPHLESLGAEALSRTDYLELLGRSLNCSDRRGSWTDMVDQDRNSTI